MNKAILIVICDFLVSSMLTMMTGMVPGYSVSTGGGQENILPRSMYETGYIQNDTTSAEELRELLDEALAQRMELEKKLKALDIQLASTQGKLRWQEKDNAALNRELLHSRSSFDNLNAELNRTKDELLSETREHGKTKAKLAASESGRAQAEKDAEANKKALLNAQSELVAEIRRHGETKVAYETSKSELKFAREKAESTGKELDSTQKELTQVRKERDDERSAHQDTRTRVIRLEGELNRSASDLRAMKNRVRNAEDANAKNSKETEKWRISAHENKRVLGVRERDLAEVKDLLARREQELLVERLKRREAEAQRDLMKDTVKDTVKQLSAKDDELQKKSDELQKKREELARKEGELQAGGGNGGRVVTSETRVFECYAGAIVRVESVISEKKFRGERTGKTTSFYPVVDFGNGRKLIIGSLNRFAGDWDVVLKFDEVTAVKISFAPPFGEESNSPKLLTDRMLVSSANPHLAAFGYSGSSVRPLKVIDAKQLRRFGVEDLFLFKSDNFEINTRLNGRVSLIADEKNPAIFIRDVGRAGLRAEQGDFVLSAQGEFVGVVSERVKINDIAGVKVLLIKDVNTFWEQAAAVPLSKNPEEPFYSGYAKGMLELRKSVRGGYDRDRD